MKAVDQAPPAPPPAPRPPRGHNRESVAIVLILLAIVIAAVAITAIVIGSVFLVRSLEIEASSEQTSHELHGDEPMRFPVEVLDQP
jgi:flagellar basal body-associated protein FliL